MKLVKKLGQPSWRVQSDCVDAWVTRKGGQLAPVNFKLARGSVQPFSIAPWAEEKIARDTPPIIEALRGDFFCMPFGGNAARAHGEQHPIHGESSNEPWQFQSCERNGKSVTLHLRLSTRVRRGQVDKHLRLRDGETAIYCRHIVSGMSGKMPLGHHATLHFPDEVGAAQISTSALRYGQVFPGDFEKPAAGGYSCLRAGAKFETLRAVPMIDGGSADLGVYPARSGFEDLAMIVHESAPDFAWTAATVSKAGYVWFALKDPRVLRSTVMWISNGGRHYPPWSGRHRNVLGLEDVTSYFHYGLAESTRPNPVSRAGFPTALMLDPKRPLSVNYIMAVAAVPRGFARVAEIRREDSGVVLCAPNGRRVRVPLDVNFLYENAP